MLRLRCRHAGLDGTLAVAFGPAGNRTDGGAGNAVFSLHGHTGLYAEGKNAAHVSMGCVDQKEQDSSAGLPSFFNGLRAPDEPL